MLHNNHPADFMRRDLKERLINVLGFAEMAA
jgi:hypothetical protein